MSFSEKPRQKSISRSWHMKSALDKIIIEKDDYTQELISDSVSLIHDANVRLNNIFF